MKMRFVQTLLGVAWLTATLWSPALADSMPGMQMGPPPLKITQTAGPYRLTLVMLPAEPYYTAAQVKSEHIHEGMLVIAGATPVQKNDPNRLTPVDLRAITPLIWEHVNPYGRFELDMDSRLALG